MQDILDDVFRMIRLESCVYFQRDFHAPWAMAIDAADMAQFHIIVQGDATVETGQGAANLSAGDIVLFPRGAAHVLADRAGRRPRPGREVIASFATDAPAFVNGGEATRVICGHYAYRAAPSHPLIDSLPGEILLRAEVGRAGGVEEGVLDLLIRESATTDPGATSVVERLAEVLLVQILRRHFARNPEQPGFLAGIMDPRLGRAIQHIHSDYDKPLTLEELARNAGMSRSAFAERFRAKTGLAPIAYVTRWRMLSAREMLGDASLSAPDIAMRTGYESEISFARAFKREFGVTPSKYRQLGG